MFYYPEILLNIICHLGIQSEFVFQHNWGYWIMVAPGFLFGCRVTSYRQLLILLPNSDLDRPSAVSILPLPASLIVVLLNFRH